MQQRSTTRCEDRQRAALARPPVAAAQAARRRLSEREKVRAAGARARPRRGTVEQLNEKTCLSVGAKAGADARAFAPTRVAWVRDGAWWGEEPRAEARGAREAREGCSRVPAQVLLFRFWGARHSLAVKLPCRRARSRAPGATRRVSASHVVPEIICAARAVRGSLWSAVRAARQACSTTPAASSSTRALSLYARDR